MKKLISLLMALVLVFSLAACSKGPELLGTYETEIDMTELVVTEFDNGAEITGSDLTLGNYLDDFSITMVTVFNEDGTYSQCADNASMEQAFTNMKNAMLPLMDDFLLYSFVTEFAAYGYDIETREDVEAILEMSWDDIVPSVLGVDTEAFISDMVDELSEDLLGDNLLQEGNYKAEDGKLYLSEGLEYDIDEEMYEIYEIDGNTVTVLAGVNVEENEYLPYPFIMTKVS